ncbi:MAG: tyrosine-type recombinase/integrase, partial [Lachnospiraceae bacterium]|nr:tyrosine-type recombinase/integrase [Lachnospiraceae bacterium]
MSDCTLSRKLKLRCKPKRHALTVPQQKAFLGFIQDNHQYHGWEPVITALLGTGMRIGECLGLRWDDVDFEQRSISVNHNLTERNTGNGSKH